MTNQDYIDLLAAAHFCKKHEKTAKKYDLKKIAKELQEEVDERKKDKVKDVSINKNR